MVAGAIEIRYQAKIRGELESLPPGLSYHDLRQMTYVLASIIADSAGDEIDRVIHAVRTMADAGPPQG